MTDKKLLKSRGFTIIEVLIVLAIAGLIMLIVFLAVPKLQQNSRNTQRTQDAANLLTGIGDFVNDNNGDTPTTATLTITNKVPTIPPVPGSGDAAVDGAKLGYYKNPNVKIVNSLPAAPTSDQLYIILGFTCQNNAPVAGSPRSYVAYYAVEPNNVAQCKG